MRLDGAVGIFGVLLSCALLVCGCKSTQGPGSEHLAAVQIKGHSALEVARVTSEVFQHAGFQTMPLPYNESSAEMRLMFDRPGTAGDTLVYGDWSGETVWYRARVQFTKLDADTQLVTCNAYRVLGRGSRHFEEEHKLTRLKKGGYQKLLDEVKAKLNPVQK